MGNKNDYIGVFDSGVGGISVLRQLKKLLPGERFLYYGDSANAPYGSRDTGKVRELTLTAVEKMMESGLKALVVACNTATSAAIHTLREKYPDLIVIGIEPALKPAVDHFPAGRIGVMATNVTLREEKFSALIEKYGAKAEIIKIPAPGLVELVESGKTDDLETSAFLTNLLAPYVDKLDALVLGCTHFPLVSDAISRILGENVELLDGGEGTARETKRRLAEAELFCDESCEILWQNSAENEEIIALCKALLEQ